ncbi:MAG: hypothetical protein PHD29_08150 [bacterium]|nr:hypothetical protein [bacterium]MDD5354043.1 hypothetical protein [bacterium]MDD5756102.1 hypothetical protein [bacterium]
MRKYFMIVAFLFLAVNLYAGSAYELNCSNCGYKTTLYYGIGDLLEVVVNGYCLTCKEYVRLSYAQPGIPKEERKDVINPVSSVYSPLFAKSKVRALYTCRFCSKLLLEILPEDLEANMNNCFCPKCNTNNISITPKTWD